VDKDAIKSRLEATLERLLSSAEAEWDYVNPGIIPPEVYARARAALEAQP